ncbi:hypothetical protein AAHA92_26475 [Salvia divinorum]|uniref:S-protein homolog n=1 Tax=Salvia divinorum TaxID=28513 RepID=A0ABD1GE15_SALDI
MIKYTLFLLIASSLFLNATAKCTLYIASNLPLNSPPLQVHCASKDYDLGYHSLATGEEYILSFDEKPFSTLFTCRFVWNKNNKVFHVYDERSKECSETGVRYYAVKPEGFYFTNVYPPKKLGFQCDWKQNFSSKC